MLHKASRDTKSDAETGTSWKEHGLKAVPLLQISPLMSITTIYEHFTPPAPE